MQNACEQSVSAPVPVLRRSKKPSLNEEFAGLIESVIGMVPDFQSYDSRKIVISVSRSRARGKNGVWAYVTPLRYLGGARTRKGRRRGIVGHYAYETKKLSRDYPEALYLVTFLIPRFFYLSFQERLETVVHELYHIHPEFRGDLRRFEAPHIHHGPTPRAFRKKVTEMTQALLKRDTTIAQNPLLVLNESAFDEHRTHRYDIPRRIFVPGAVLLPPEEIPAIVSKPKLLTRHTHPRLLDRLLRLVGSFALLAALTSFSEDEALWKEMGETAPTASESSAAEPTAEEGPPAAGPAAGAAANSAKATAADPNADPLSSIDASSFNSVDTGAPNSAAAAAPQAGAKNATADTAGPPEDLDLGSADTNTDAANSGVEGGKSAPPPQAAQPERHKQPVVSEGTIPRPQFRDESSSDILPQRYLVMVKGLEDPALRPAPSEASPELFPVKHGELFFLSSEDSTREWAYIQTRKTSGWIRKRYLRLVKPLPVPGEQEATAALNGGEQASSNEELSGTTIDGESAFSPGQTGVGKSGNLQRVDRAHLTNLKEGVDVVTALEPGQFYAEPNPLSERYGLIEAGDQVTFLQKDKAGQWAKIRLDLTGEEGWYPAGWLRSNQLSHLKEPTRLGANNFEADLGFGSQGNNLGLSALYSWDPRWSNSARTRFELGGYASYWMGEGFTINNSSFKVSYIHVGVLPRFVTFNGYGNLAGALEAGFFYKIPIGSVTGIDQDVLRRNGLDILLRPGLAMVYGARGYYLLNPKMQLYLGFRGTLNSIQSAYFLVSGVSFKF